MALSSFLVLLGLGFRKFGGLGFVFRFRGKLRSLGLGFRKFAVSV